MTPPLLEFDAVGFSYGAEYPPVFKDLTLKVPPGLTSLVGPNGRGKSTWLLLASGRLKPTQGTVRLFGADTAALDEQVLPALASVIYQNMEFDQPENLGDLLTMVQDQGFRDDKHPDILAEIIQVLELGRLLTRPVSGLSKGAMQRALIAFALLYGSRALFLDEPVFALEPSQKHRALGLLTETARAKNWSLVFSVHEFDLSLAYSSNTLLFESESRLKLGTSQEMHRPEYLESLYQVPMTLLKQKEFLYREHLKKDGLSPETAQALENSHPFSEKT